MKFEIDDTQMDEAAKKKLVDCVGLLGLSRIEEPKGDSGYVDMRVHRPKDGEKYYFIHQWEYIDNNIWAADCEDDCNPFPLWAIYNTKEQAEYALERMKVRAELERFSLSSLDHGNPYGVGTFYHIRLYKDFFDSHNVYYVNAGPCFSCAYDFVAFKTLEDCRNAIEAVGADRIKKYLFNVWD